MNKVLEQIEINANCSHVFELAQDYDLRLEWDPFLEDIRFVSEDKTMKRGLRVWVKSYNGMEMTVEYLNYTPPHHVSMKMVEGPWMFAGFSGLWKFEEKGPECTKAIFKYEFEPRWYLLIGSYFIRRRLSKDMKRRLEALKKAAEATGF